METFKEIDIRSLLPQQPPFVMVDRLLHCDQVFTRSELTVTDDNLFTGAGKLTESGVIENIAQTCAARMGYIHRMLQGSEVKTGFIGAIRNLNIYFLPQVGDVLTTEIEVKSEVFNITLVEAKVKVYNQLVAECEMKISE